MKDFIKRHRIVLTAVGALLVGAGSAVGVMASIPSSQGLIHGCYSDQDGKLSVVDSTGSCGTGDTALNWDRGVLAYGLLSVDVSNPNNPLIVVGQDRGIASVTLSPSVELGYCIELSGSLENDMRFPHVQSTSVGATGPISVLANTGVMTGTVSDACDSTTDVFIDMSASTTGVYFSVF